MPEKEGIDIILQFVKLTKCQILVDKTSPMTGRLRVYIP